MARNESSPAQPGAQRRTTLIWWSLAAGSLLAGYADLVRGGETIAPILLVLGYCVLVPLAILRS
jgi:peptidoglycan/LPS O-acetylase OafA/YrhL